MATTTPLNHIWSNVPSFISRRKHKGFPPGVSPCGPSSRPAAAPRPALPYRGAIVVWPATAITEMIKITRFGCLFVVPRVFDYGRRRAYLNNR
jgi:hypothetical protein